MVQLTEATQIGAPEIDAVRAFNRSWTAQIGVLDAGLLGLPYSLTEARVIFELAQSDSVDLADVRRRLELDAGYLSRIVARLRASGIAETAASRRDGRRQVIALTQRGRDVFADLDGRAAAQVSVLLESLSSEDRTRLLGAIATIRDVLEPDVRRQGYLLRPLRPGDLGWVVLRHGVLYAEEYGWDETFEALVARIVADYAAARDPRREGGWIAELDGAAVGCVFCMRKDDDTARLRLLLVDARARGRGIGRRLVDECLRFARHAGYGRVELWTNDVLVSARRIYESAGFGLDGEEAHTSFGHDLVGQVWSVEL